MQSLPFTLSGKTILITGAGMGMGRLYALRAATEGAAVVVIWDVNAQTAHNVGTEVTALGARTVVQQVDLGDLDSIKATADALRKEHGISAPDVIINNAGIVKGGPFWEHDSEKHTRAIMAVNALAPMYVTAEFLPAMMQGNKASRILNIASAAGTLANPNMSVSTASKWVLIGWSDSLRLELVRAHSNIKVTPWTAKLAMGLRGALPTMAWDVVAGNVFKVYNSMDHFTGRPTVKQGAGSAKEQQ